MYITGFSPKRDERNMDHYRRENSFHRELSLVDLDKGTAPIIARFYGARATVYCVVWVFVPGAAFAAIGFGKAGGYGYHKHSAALQSAMKAAGFHLGADFSGTGDAAMIDAITQAGAFVGVSRGYVHNSHA